MPAAGVIGEAMVLLTLTRFVLEKFGGDSLVEVRDNLLRYRERTLAMLDRVDQETATFEAGAASLVEAESGSGGDD